MKQFRRDRPVAFTAIVGAVALVVPLMVAWGLASDSKSKTPAHSALEEHDMSIKPATIDASGTPSANWKAADPVIAPASSSDEHRFTFHVQQKLLEVAPGVHQMMWTYNGTVPGPALRGRVGDKFIITLINDGSIGHSIDFHASEVPMNNVMRTIGTAGESLTYEFTAHHAGIWMYHCGSVPALNHIGNGMYGAVIIDPPRLSKVDHEFLLVQSELYFGHEGEVGDFDKMKAAKPDAVVFNGYYNQYKYSPIHVQAGDRVRVWVSNVGPSNDSSFHIVGTQFDTVYKEGAYRLRPGSDLGGSQSVDLSASQGGFAEFDVPADGNYAIVTHRFADANAGALGILVAGDAAPHM